MFGGVALHWAVFGGNIDVLKTLIKSGCPVDATDIRGGSSLHLAARNGKKEIVAFLLEKKANPNKKAENNKTPLHFAASIGNSPIALMLLEKGAAVDEPDSDGQTALQFAVQKGFKNTAELLMKKGASPSHIIPHNGQSLLHVAALSGSRDMVELLLSQKAPLNPTDKNGFTPLDYASKYGFLAIKKRLQNKGAKTKKFNETVSLDHLLSEKLKPGQMNIWYLGHCGWAIKTHTKFLIFDYWKEKRKPRNPPWPTGLSSPKNLKSSPPTSISAFSSLTPTATISINKSSNGKNHCPQSPISTAGTRNKTKKISISQPPAKLKK